MEVLIKTSQLLLSLSIIIIVHEFGHFIAAKAFKTKVTKFYLFFDPWFSLFKFKKGETEYGIGWLPLGGYVKIAGMIDESMDTEQLKQPVQSHEFRSKPAWQRLIIMIGGIVMNVILGIFVFSMILFTWGEEYIPNANLTYGIAVDSTAMKIGLQNGDKIIAVDGKPLDNYRTIPALIALNGAKEIEVSRNGHQEIIPIPEGTVKDLVDNKGQDIIAPRIPFIVKDFGDDSQAKKAGMKKDDKIIAVDQKPMVFYDEIHPYLLDHKGKMIHVTTLRGKDTVVISFMLPESGLMGVIPKQGEDIFTTKKIHYGLLASFPAGVDKATTTLVNYIKQFKLIFSSKVQGYKHLGGFISMGKVMSPTWDWLSLWQYTALFSIIIGFMNFLPIPMLDGGYIIFVLFEMVTRIKVPDKFIEYANMVGLVILLALMLFANGNDVFHLFVK